MFDYTSLIYFSTTLWMSFGLAAFGAFGLFFSRKVPYLIYFTALVVSASLCNLFNASYYLNDVRGEMAALFLIIGFGMETGMELYLLKKKKIQNFSPLFYALAFMSFFLLATARDLLSIVIGLEGFQVCLYGFAAKRDYLKPIRLTLLKEGLVSYSALVYGLSVLYVTRGQITLLGLRQSLRSLHPIDPFVLIGIGLIALGILIKINGFILISGKKRTHV